jgi:hypothetical protein
MNLGGPQSQPGHSGEEKYSQPLPELEPLIIQPIAQCYITELSQLINAECGIVNDLIVKRTKITDPVTILGHKKD